MAPVVVSHANWKGAAVSVAASTPSTSISTRVTPTLSLALAATLTVPRGVRTIPVWALVYDVDYEPVPVLPRLVPDAGRDLDIHAVERRVQPDRGHGERVDLVGEHAGRPGPHDGAGRVAVDVGVARLDAGEPAVDLCRVERVQSGGQPVVGRVLELDGVREVVGAHDAEHRAEALRAVEPRSGFDADAHTG